MDTNGLMAGKAWVNEKAKNVENKGAEKKDPEHDGKKVFMKEIEPEPQPERTPAESRSIYTRAMTDMHNTNVMAIYARQCLGNLEYVKAKDIGAAADDQYKDLEEKLSAVAALSDESNPRESKEKIDDMLSAVHNYISDNSHADNATLKTICLNLKSFRKAARAYYQENDIQTEEDKTYKQILEDEYPNMMRGVSENEKRRFSIEAEKQRENIRKLLKKVRENYRELQNCNPHGVTNSAQFNRMFAAVERANNLTENSTMMEIRKAISDVHATASIYNDKINAQGMFGGQLIVGKKKGYYRRQAAMNLKNVSIDLLFRMDDMTDPYRSLTDQITHPTVHKGNKQKNTHPELKIGK
ncbi:MAG: hypothetical protein IKQ49_00335 [Eubacterium sp.]|nr:hypothetical protein [Eubacterium sp.]